MSRKAMNIYLAIPAFNEETTIEKVIRDVLPYVRKIVVVNDASADKTEAIVKTFPEILYVKNTVHHGYAKTLNTAVKTAFGKGAEYVITFDADGQHRVADLKAFIAAITADMPDLALGKRSFKNRIMEDIFGFYTNLRFGISDPLCGMKAYRNTIYKRYGCLESKYTLATELVFKALKDNARFIEIPITPKKRLHQSSFAGNVQGNLLELKAFINALFV